MKRPAGKLERSWQQGLSRRGAVRGLAAFVAGSPLLLAQQDLFRDHSRVPGLDELTTAFDFEAVAYEKLPRAASNYTAYGSAGEFTLRRNREVFDWVELVPRAVPRTVPRAGAGAGSIETATEILGTKMQFPILVAPTAAHLALHPGREAAMHQGCSAAGGTPMIVSGVASMPMGEIAEAASSPLWYQLYPLRPIEENRERLDQAQAAGCRAVVVTIDQQAPYFERTQHDRNLSTRRNRRQGRPRRQALNAYRIRTQRLWYEWKLFDELRSLVEAPLLAKGILTAEDALRCVEQGLDGIVVSNHGGRALDYAPSTLEVLPEIVDAVGGRIPVLVDGGFRRGSDILKALALGAAAVCLGRVPRWGLAAFGAPGVQRVLEILQAELVLAMAHTGRSTLSSIDRSLVRMDFS